MGPLKIFNILLIFTIGSALAADSIPEINARASSVTTVKLIQKHGYPVESHKVQTSDGYILTMHRIPYSSKTGNDGRKRPVAFLMHGLLGSSSDWVLSEPENGLAFILSDAGFDVWMGNARGNTYSKKHVTLNPRFQPFWNFSWHEIAIYDLPAMIDFVLFWTQQVDLRYIGFSQGTTAFFVLNSLDERFKIRIRSAHLLAPVAFMEHIKSIMGTVGGPLLGHPNMFVELFGSFEFLPNTRAMELLGSVACSDSAPTQKLCTNVLFLIGGYDSPFLNQTMIPEIMATSPAGSSINQLQHYLQEYNSGCFCQFDYGSLRNKIKYGSKKPPSYDLSKVDVPVFMYYSDNDYLADVVDVQRAILALKPGTVKRAYCIPFPKWAHFDFLWGIDVKKHVYDIVLEDINSS